MYSLLDLLLFFSAFALPMLIKADFSNRKFIIYIFLLAQTIAAVRLITDSAAVVIGVIFAFTLFILIKSIISGKSNAFYEYVVISKDENGGKIALSDGRKTLELQAKDAEKYCIGQIVRMKANYLGNFV